MADGYMMSSGSTIGSAAFGSLNGASLEVCTDNHNRPQGYSQLEGTFPAA